MLPSDGPASPPYGPSLEPEAVLHAERDRRKSRFGDEFDDCPRPGKMERLAPSGRAHPVSGTEDVQQHFERS